MIFKKMVKNLISSIFVIFLLSNYSALAANSSFDVWLNEFKTKAINKGISKTVVNDLMSKKKTILFVVVRKPLIF